MTWYITTSPTELPCGVIRVGHTQALEIIALDGTYHAVKTAEEAKRAGFSQCRRATAEEAKRAEVALDKHRHRLAWAQAQADDRKMRAWREVEYQGRTWWGRQTDDDRVELVTPAGDQHVLTDEELIAGRYLSVTKAAKAEGALRTATVLAKTAKPVAPERIKPAVTQLVSSTKSAVELAQERLKDLKRRGLIHRHASL